MKNWCKILEVGEYDILVQRLVTKEDGEHVKITVRMPDGQFVKTASFGDDDGSIKDADDVFLAYEEKQALMFVSELEKLMKEDEEKDNNKES